MMTMVLQHTSTVPKCDSILFYEKYCTSSPTDLIGFLAARSDMRPTDTRQFRIRASYKSAKDCRQRLIEDMKREIYPVARQASFDDTISVVVY